MPLDQEPEEVEGALEGGARVCGDEAEVRICEATLSRTEEECHPTVRDVRAGESVLGAEKTVALGTGLARERRLLITGEPPKQAEDRKRPNPNACTGLAEHLLPRRHELIQSFPNVHRHANTSAVDIHLERNIEAVAMEVKDYGRGIPPEELQRLQEPSSIGSVGLAGMRERVHELAGRLDIRSDHCGTVVSVTIPVPCTERRCIRSE